MRCYLVPRAHVDYLVKCGSTPLPERDERGRPLVAHALGPLLDPSDLGLPPRHHALMVTLRRRTVVFRVMRIETLTAPGPLQPLGSLITARLARPWLLGAVVVADMPILVLDLRRIAADVALGVV